MVFFILLSFPWKLPGINRDYLPPDGPQWCATSDHRIPRRLITQCYCPVSPRRVLPDFRASVSYSRLISTLRGGSRFSKCVKQPNVPSLSSHNRPRGSDHTKLEQALLNMLSNRLAFSKCGHANLSHSARVTKRGISDLHVRPRLTRENSSRKARQKPSRSLCFAEMRDTSE